MYKNVGCLQSFTLVKFTFQFSQMPFSNSQIVGSMNKRSKISGHQSPVHWVTVSWDQAERDLEKDPHWSLSFQNDRIPSSVPVQQFFLKFDRSNRQLSNNYDY